MADITVRNISGNSITIPGGYYVGIIRPGAAITFDVPDTDEYPQDARVEALINSGTIRIEYASTDTQDRPFPTYTTATLPAANSVTSGTVVLDSTTNSFVVSDGTSWGELATGGSVNLTAAATAIAANRFVGLNGSALLVASPAAGERPLGVSTDAFALSGTGRVQLSGACEVMPSTAIAADDELIAVPGGFAAPFQAADVSLGAAVAGVDASDDLLQTNLPDTIQAVCAGDETGNTMVLYGKVGTAYTKETVTLGTAGTYTSTNTWAAIYAVSITAASTGTIDVEDGSSTANIFPQIAALAAARVYGSIVPGVTTDSEGQAVQIRAGGANAAEVVLWGTDYAGSEQAEIVTMNGTAWVESTLAYRSLDAVFIGADGIVFNAGVTSQYDQQVEANERNEIRAYALEAEAVAGATVRVFLLPQAQGLDVGTVPVPYHVSLVSYGGGGTSTTATVLGVAATDAVQATLNASTNAVQVTKAVRTAADTVTITFSADPGAATTVALTVWRP